MSIETGMGKDDMVHIHNGISLSLKNEIISCAPIFMDLRDYPKWSKSNTNVIWYHIYVESKKNDIEKLETHRLQNQMYDYQKGNIVGDKLRVLN